MVRTPANVVQIFFGCPHKCSSIEELENNIVRLLLANGNGSPYGIANTIRELARSINEINEAFFAFKIPLMTQILSVYSTEQEPSSRVSFSSLSRGFLPGKSMEHKSFREEDFGR